VALVDHVIAGPKTSVSLEGSFWNCRFSEHRRFGVGAAQTRWIVREAGAETCRLNRLLAEAGMEAQIVALHACVRCKSRPLATLDP
jgi:hypothetical protein